jgi:hypothetical protein
MDYGAARCGSRKIWSHFAGIAKASEITYITPIETCGF